MVGDRYGEKKFIVLTAIHSASGQIHVEFFCHDSGLIVDGDMFLVNTAAGIALFADMHKLR